MAYDEDLAARVRELLAAESGLREQRMFGGLSFLLDGNLAVAVSTNGGVLVRVDPSAVGRLVATTRAEAAIMGGRTMRVWLRIGPADLRTRRQLAAWVTRGASYARSLPAKAH